jgi:hypothetical protein
MSINSNFDLRKFRDLLLKENYESSNLQEAEGEFDINGHSPEEFDLEDTIYDMKGNVDVGSGWAALWDEWNQGDVEMFKYFAGELLFILGRDKEKQQKFHKFYKEALSKLKGNSEELNEEVERLGILGDINNQMLNSNYSDEEKIDYLNTIIDYCNKEIISIQLPNPDSLEEMAKIAGDLKSSIEAVIAANPELQGLALKKAIKGDSAVINALDGDDLYDNQLNKFIALSKGERELGQRGRKANPDKPAAEPKAKVAKSPKLKITNPTADEKPVAASFIDGGDAEDIADEMAARKAAKGNKRLGTAAEKLAQVTKEMKALIPAYQVAKGTAKEAAIVAQLKDLTAEKKSLEAKVFKEPKALSAADLMGGEEA